MSSTDSINDNAALLLHEEEVEEEEEEEWWSSWNASHSRTCRSRNTLFATPQQVLDYANINTNDNNNTSLIYWSLPHKDQVILWNNSAERLKAVCQPPPSPTTSSSVTTSTTTIQSESVVNAATTTPQKSKGMFQYVTDTLFSPLLSVLSPGPPQYDMGDEQDDALRSWDDDAAAYCEEEEDAYYQQEQQATKTNDNGGGGSSNGESISWDAPILNLKMTQECLELLESALALHESSSSSSPLESTSTFPKIIPKRRIAHEQQCWMDWVRENVVQPNNDNKKSLVLTRLSDIEMDFLLECLAQKKKITLIPSSDGNKTRKTDLIVLAPPLVQEGEEETTQETYREVLASWWELSSAIASLEIHQQQLSNQAQHYAKKALQEKKRAATTAAAKAGLVSFKLHKQFMQRLDQTQGQLMNLEQTRNALEESWHCRQVVQALATSNKTLQMLRQQQQQQQQQQLSSAQEDDNEIDNLMETYREEMDHINDVGQTLANGNFAVYDEDDLLKELEGLSFEDDDDAAENNDDNEEKPENNTNNDGSSKVDDKSQSAAAIPMMSNNNKDNSKQEEKAETATAAAAAAAIPSTKKESSNKKAALVAE